MRPEAAREFAQALSLIDEADGINPGKAARALIHTAYYAMYHAARACLLTRNSDVTTRHERITNALEKASESPGVAEAVALIRKAYALRIAADYDPSFKPGAALAVEALGNARRFIDLCRAEFGLDAFATAPGAEPRGPSS